MLTPCLLIITAKMSQNVHIQNEDYSIVCSYIQNIKLLAWANQIGTGHLDDFQDIYSLIELQQDEGIAGIHCLDYFAGLPKYIRKC